MTTIAKPLHILTIVAVFTLCSGVTTSHAQVDTGTDTGAGTDTGGNTGGAGFSPEEPDLSVFDGIDRSAETSFGGEGLTGNGGGAAGRGGGVGGGGGFGGLGGFFGGLSQAFGGAGQSSSQKPAIRVRLRSAVQVAPLSNNQIQRSAVQTLSQAPSRVNVQGVNVSINQGTAVLNGTVRSEKDRRMSELLMRLEPGVRRVENRVVVLP